MASGSADREFVYLFPNAIRIIGVNHNLDNVLKLVICSIPFYAAFQERAKALCRFLRNDSYRLVLQALEDGSSRSVFTCFSANFDKWRWGTLASVCSELIRVEKDLVFLMSLACYQVLQLLSKSACHLFHFVGTLLCEHLQLLMARRKITQVGITCRNYALSSTEKFSRKLRRT
jgi:hypothetical protein